MPNLKGKRARQAARWLPVCTFAGPSRGQKVKEDAKILENRPAEELGTSRPRNAEKRGDRGVWTLGFPDRRVTFGL